MRSLSTSVFVLSLLASACGGGSAASQPAGQATGTPGHVATPAQLATPGQVATPPAATPAGSTSAPPPVGGVVVTVTLTGGADAGTYSAVDPTGALNPNCSVGLIGPEGWGVQFSTVTVGPTDLGSLQLVSAAPGKENDPNAVFSGVKFLMTVTIGPSLGADSRDYEIRDPADDTTAGTGSAQITDNGTTAVIHATGTTKDGVGIDATVNCPSVIRQ